MKTLLILWLFWISGTALLREQAKPRISNFYEDTEPTGEANTLLILVVAVLITLPQQILLNTIYHLAKC